MVEHSLGKGEVESSILSCSTSDFNELGIISQVFGGLSKRCNEGLIASIADATSAEHLNSSGLKCKATLMLPAEYMSQIVLPTVDEFLAATGDRRLAYIASYYVRDYLARAEAVSCGEIERKMRGAAANLFHSFDVIEGICNGSKHCGNDRDNFRFVAGAEHAVPAFALDLPGSGFDVSRWDMPGLLVVHKGHRTFVDRCVCATLSAYGQIFPQAFASIDFRRYREWASKI